MTIDLILGHAEPRGDLGGWCRVSVDLAEDREARRLERRVDKPLREDAVARVAWSRLWSCRVLRRLSGHGMLDVEFLTSIAHPIRLRALVLFEHRPSSIRELADDVGIEPGAAGHHVRMLRRAGLVEVVETRVKRGQDEAVYSVRTKGWARLERELAKLVPNEGR